MNCCLSLHERSAGIQTDGLGSISLRKWVRIKGVSAVTAWRWRKRGWLRTVNICGREYVTPDAAADFERRAAAGEFSSPHPVPAPPAGVRAGGQL